MGSSISGVLFYGYCWNQDTDELAHAGDDEDYDEAEDYDGADEAEDDGPFEMESWATKTLVAQGHVDPWEAILGGEDQDVREYLDEHRAEFNAWCALKAELIASTGVAWGSHCSSEYRMPYLYIPSSEITAWRGDSEPVTQLTVGEDWNAKLDSHLKASDLTPPAGENQPGWWLVAFSS